LSLAISLVVTAISIMVAVTIMITILVPIPATSTSDCEISPAAVIDPDAPAIRAPTVTFLTRGFTSLFL
jgi:hypothetical protein